jgi:hypothetical protein
LLRREFSVVCQSLRQYAGAAVGQRVMTGVDAVEKQVESFTITPVFVADLSVEGERMAGYVHVIDHPKSRKLRRGLCS